VQSPTVPSRPGLLAVPRIVGNTALKKSPDSDVPIQGSNLACMCCLSTEFPPSTQLPQRRLIVDCRGQRKSLGSPLHFFFLSRHFFCGLILVRSTELTAAFLYSFCFLSFHFTSVRKDLACSASSWDRH